MAHPRIKGSLCTYQLWLSCAVVTRCRCGCYCKTFLTLSWYLKPKTVEIQESILIQPFERMALLTPTESNNLTPVPASHIIEQLWCTLPMSACLHQSILLYTTPQTTCTLGNLQISNLTASNNLHMQLWIFHLQYTSDPLNSVCVCVCVANEYT